MNNNKELMQRRGQTIPCGVGQIHPAFADRAKNCRMWDIEGHEYLDFAGRIAVLNARYLHSRVVVVVEAQLKEPLRVCLQVLAYESYLGLCEIMNQRMPGNFIEKVLLVTTGPETVENVVEITRATTKRSDTIASSSAYHGRAHYTLALTGKVNPYSAGVGLMPGHVYHTFYSCPLRGINEDDAIASIHRIFRDDTAPEDITTIVIEPIQGEGGFYAPSPVFMQCLRALYDGHEIMLTIDEVQGGAGRTSTLFAMERIGAALDPTTFAKSIANGFPLAGVIGRAEVMSAVTPDGLGGTYADNPITCMVALEVLKVFEQENLLQKANDLEQRLKNGLLAIVEKHPEIGDVYELGAMVTIELSEDGNYNKPGAELAAEIVVRVRDRGLILLPCGPYYNVLRILVPLTIEGAQIRQGLEVTSRCPDETKQQRRSYAGGDAARLVRSTGIQVG